MFRPPTATPFVKALTASVFGAFVLQLILQNWVGVPTTTWLALDTGRLSIATAWQLFTYPFAAPTTPNYVFSFLISLLFVWWMLSAFESRFGRKRTIELCVVSTVSAGLGALLVAQITPSGQLLLGTTPWLLAATSGFAWSFRGQGRLSFFGVIDLSAEQLVGVVVGFSVLMFLAGGQLPQFVADLVAIGAGIFLIQRTRRRSSRSTNPFKKSSDSSRLRLLN